LKVHFYQKIKIRGKQSVRKSTKRDKLRILKMATNRVWVYLDGVKETNNVWERRRKILMPSSYRFKPKKQEVPDNILVVIIVIQTGDHMVNPQLLLGVFQQRDKRVLAAFRQLVLSDCHIEPVLPEYGFPLAANSPDPGS